MLGHCILVGSKQGNRGKTQALVDGNGPLQPVTPQLAMTGMGQVLPSANDGLGTVTLTLPGDAFCCVENSATG